MPVLPREVGRDTNTPTMAQKAFLQWGCLLSVSPGHCYNRSLVFPWFIIVIIVHWFSNGSSATLPISRVIAAIFCNGSASLSVPLIVISIIDFPMVKYPSLPNSIGRLFS